jgi:hypothetical protein
MLLNDGSVLLQFTDHGIKTMGDQSQDKGGDVGLFEGIVRNVALSAVKNLFDHSIVLPLRDVSAATVRNGEVIVTTCSGREVFSQVKVNDAVQRYPQDGAEAFVKNLMLARRKQPPCTAGQQR